MKIAEVKIEKFRAIRSSAVFVGSELALVGQNSAGKSSVLRALNAFFNFDNERDSFERGRHRFQPTATSIVEICFSDTPAACAISRITAGSDVLRVRLKYRNAETWQVYTAGKWIAAPGDLHEELCKYIRYVYVPLRRDHEISGWGDRGLLQAAVEAWVRYHTRNRDTISPRVAALGSDIRRRAFNGLSKQLRKITPLNGPFTFSLEYSNQPDYRVLLRDLVLRVTEGVTTVDLEDCGSGTQSMTAFALYSYLAELEGSKYVLGIEEPELNLHPQAQRELLENLRNLPLQVIFTTHSTVMIDALKHHEVVLCRRVQSTTRGIEVTTTQLSATFWKDHGLDETRYYHFYRRRNSEFFFAKFVILTESPIDGEIVKEVLRRAGTDASLHGVSLISVDGVPSLPYAFHLMRALRLNFATIIDKDYFMPYLHDDLEPSRDVAGFPRYKREFRNGTLIKSMVPVAADRSKLLTLLHTNHSRAMGMLEKANIFCFRWSLEIDLVASLTARQMLFSAFKIPTGADQNTRALLVDRKRVLKRLENILPVVQALQPSNLPNSYKRLRKVLPALVRRSAMLS